MSPSDRAAAVALAHRIHHQALGIAHRIAGVHKKPLTRERLDRLVEDAIRLREEAVRLTWPAQPC